MKFRVVSYIISWNELIKRGVGMALDFIRKEHYNTEDLIRIVALLRAPGGCPWDQAQTHASIKKNFIEETYEVIEAINRQSTAGLQEELGDVLLQVALHAQMEAEAGHFDFNDVADGICKKLIFRHPHVFGDVKAENTDDALASWDAAKLKEKGMKKVSQSMVSIPRELTALMRAQKVQHKAAKQGFDWPDRSGAMDKLDEEINELKIALDQGEPTSIADEFGDVLFSLVNAARLYKINVDNALEQTNRKFTRRFNYIEDTAKEQGVNMKDMTIEQMDNLWNEAKEQEKAKE